MVNNSIYTNPSAFTALQNLSVINRKLEVSQRAISSGLKVASATDNTSSFAIAQGIRGEIAAIETSNRAVVKLKGIVDYNLAATEGISGLMGELKGPNQITLRLSLIGHDLINKNGLLEWFLSQEHCRGYSKYIFSGLTTNELTRIIRDYIFKKPSLYGLYNVSGYPISKYDLFKLIAEKYNLKTEYAKADLAHNQLWYGLADDRAVTINKVFRCSVLNDAGEYIRIPRLSNQDIKITHTE